MENPTTIDFYTGPHYALIIYIVDHLFFWPDIKQPVKQWPDFRFNPEHYKPAGSKKYCGQHGISIINKLNSMKDANNINEINDLCFRTQQLTRYKIAKYRAINFVSGLICMSIIFGLIVSTEMLFNQWVFFGVFTLFTIYNFIHCVVNVVYYLKRKSNHKKKVWRSK